MTASNEKPGQQTELDNAELESVQGGATIDYEKLAPWNLPNHSRPKAPPIDLSNWKDPPPYPPRKPKPLGWDPTWDGPLFS